MTTTLGGWVNVLAFRTLRRSLPACLPFSMILGWSGCGSSPNPSPDAGPDTSSRVAPVAVITEVAGASTGQSRPLCSELQLSAEQSTFPPGDQVQFNWSIAYSGSDPSGPNVQLVPCDGVASSVADQRRCLFAVAPGSYAVTLSITDTPPGGLAADALTSQPTVFVALVDVDTPPCLQQTDPDMHAQRILLSRSTDLGSTYESRTFRVLRVADDCNPYPGLAGRTEPPTRFVWSLYDATQTPPQWVAQPDTTDSFTISQGMFPQALPGDTLKVRVEVRDAAVQRLYEAGVSACPLEQTDICCGSGGCMGTNDCVRWATWTVQFQP